MMPADGTIRRGQDQAATGIINRLINQTLVTYFMPTRAPAIFRNHAVKSEEEIYFR